MKIDMQLIDSLYHSLGAESRGYLDLSIAKVVQAKRNGGKVVVATGSGPNLHEGVTTLIAEMMHKGLVDGVTTSSAVVAHEMGGVLDKVKRFSASVLGDLAARCPMPLGGLFELTQLTEEQWDELRNEMQLDEALAAACIKAEGTVIIKAAGNMAYPMGLRTELLAAEIQGIASTCGLPFEVVAGWGADERTMIGAGAKNGLPVLVSIPQLVGGGAVGMAIGDSIAVSQRSARIAGMLGQADVIIESAVALTQEIHDGPFETHTGHGIWAGWNGYPTYSLEGKTLIRFDLDENLKKAWDLDKADGSIQAAIDRGLPKTKMSRIPFRMEMSAFSRLKTSIPVIGDIGVIWPVLAAKAAEQLGVELSFISSPQQTDEGRAMRETIARDIRAVDKGKLYEKFRAMKHFGI